MKKIIYKNKHESLYTGQTPNKKQYPNSDLGIILGKKWADTNKILDVHMKVQIKIHFIS